MFRRCVTPRVVVPKGSVNAHQTKVTLRPAKIPTMSGKRVRFVPRRALSIVPDQCLKKIPPETDMESQKEAPKAEKTCSSCKDCPGAVQDTATDWNKVSILGSGIIIGASSAGLPGAVVGLLRCL